MNDGIDKEVMCDLLLYADLDEMLQNVLEILQELLESGYKTHQDDTQYNNKVQAPLI